MKYFLNEKEILNPCQYGFREKHPTQHAIIDIVNTIQTNMDRHLYSCGVFIDLTKAFDTVDHSVLLDQLHHYGFCGIINKWFSSYLQNRTQTVQIGTHISKKTITTCGVPIGPSLFHRILMIFAAAQINSTSIFALTILIFHVLIKILNR